VTFTGAIGRACYFPLRLIIAACVRLRIHPNLLTFIGVLINVAAGWVTVANVKNGALTLYTYKGDKREQIAVVR